MGRKVVIIGSNGGCEYSRMFRSMGWEVVQSIYEADLVQFTGGEDVSPELYGDKKHPATMSYMPRDLYEMEVFMSAKLANKPMAGICRGGQFLNVSNGGSMFQHVNNHAIAGTHEALDVHSGEIISVTSTHHQMMRPADNAIIICTATRSTKREYMVEDEIVVYEGNEADIESVYYRETKSLCFQPHPEFQGRDVGDTKDYYFKLLNKYLGV